MSLDHYSLLELSATATPDEIKRAYARAIRKNQKDSEKLAQIHAAYATLSDPKARAQYDALKHHGGEIDTIMEQVQTCFEREEWSEAIRNLKKVFVIAPELEEPQNQLGQAFLYNEQHNEAIRVFEKLTASSSDTPLYWRNLGYALRINADGLERGTKKKGELIDRAVRAYETAHDLEPQNLKDFIDIANCHLSNNNNSLALSWAERAVGIDLNLTTLEALIFMARVNIYDNNYSGLDAIAQRVCNTTPSDNEDILKAVAHRLSKLAHEVWLAAKKFNNESLHRSSAILLKHSTALHNNDDDINEFAELVIHTADALDEYDRFDNDKNILEGLKMYGTYLLAEAAGEKVSEWKWDKRDAIECLDGLSNSEVLSGLRSFKKKYPAIYWLCDELFIEMEQKLGKEEREIADKKEQERLAEQKRREQSQREEEERRRRNEQIKQEQKQIAEEERRRQEVELLRFEQEEENRRRLRLLWWKRYGWVVALVFITLSTALFPMVKIEYAKYKVAEEARIEQQKIEEQARIAREQEDEKERLKQFRPEEIEKRLRAKALQEGFILKKNIVIDKSTGLNWSRNANIAEKQMTWDVATEYVKSLNYGGYSDWRLPTLEELSGFANRGGNTPYVYLNDIGFKSVQSDLYWTNENKKSSSYSSDDASTFVSMGNGRVGPSVKYYSFYVWPVRGKKVSEPTEEKTNETSTSTNGSSYENRKESSTITRSEVSSFISRYLASVDSHSLDDIMSMYADRVDYFTWGNVPVSAIRKDKANHFKRWKQINSEFNGNFSINDIPSSPGKMSVAFRFSFYVIGDKKSVRGVADNKWIVQKSGNTIKIIDEKQTVSNRETQVL